MWEQKKPIQLNGVFNEDNAFASDHRVVAKALHNFKANPGKDSFHYIVKAVKNASDTVYVENVVRDFAQSMYGYRYTGFLNDFQQLLGNNQCDQ